MAVLGFDLKASRSNMGRIMPGHDAVHVQCAPLRIECKRARVRFEERMTMVTRSPDSISGGAHSIRTDSYPGMAALMFDSKAPGSNMGRAIPLYEAVHVECARVHARSLRARIRFESTLTRSRPAPIRFRKARIERARTGMNVGRRESNDEAARIRSARESNRRASGRIRFGPAQTMTLRPMTSIGCRSYLISTDENRMRARENSIPGRAMTMTGAPN
jgi:hypothetical protein